MRVILVLAGLMAVALAGCFSPEPPGDSSDSDDPCVVESADDYSCDEAAGNRSADQVAHLHDYWQGKSTVRLIDAEQQIGTPVYGSCDAMPVRYFVPPDEATVYQGTGQVDVETRFTPGPDHRAGPAELWIKQADQDAAQHVGDWVDGETISIELPYNASDLPHQRLSAWEFWVYFHPDPDLQPTGCRLFPRGTLGITVDIHKTLEIQPFPGHPDHWSNATELELLDEYATFDLVRDQPVDYCDHAGGSDPEGGCQMHWRGFSPRDGRIVPPGTDHLRITLTAEPEPGYEDVGLELAFHGADTRTMENIEPVEASPPTWVFEVPADGRTDGPYAQQSQWTFQVSMETASGQYSGDWRMEGVAVESA